MTRPKKPAANLYKNRNKALMAVAIGIGAGFLIGIPASFVRGRRSLPWEPFDIVVSGGIWAAVITVFTLLVAILMNRYVALYESGTEVFAKVVSEQQRGRVRGVVVAFVDAAQQTRYSWVAPSRLPVGGPARMIVGKPGSKLVLIENPPEGFTRGSALDHQQIAQLAGG